MARSCEDLRCNESPDSEANPFLFSNFLKKETIVSEDAQVWRNFDSSTESVDHAPFPDLLNTKKNNASTGSKQKIKESKKSKKQNANSQKIESKRRILKIVDDEVETVEESEIGKILEKQGTNANNLSFDHSDCDDVDNSDSSGSSTLESSYILTSINESSSNPNLHTRVKELERENKILQKNLKQLEDDLENERKTNSKRINMLVEELRAAKKKELEETATLENVVQMVEENLRQTTQRALKAEASVSKLKDEIKFLREETVSKTKHDHIVEDYEFRLESIRQKSRDASRLMHTAADKTEPLLKELLAGVSSLHIYAEQFENIDKIADVNPTRDRVV